MKSCHFHYKDLFAFLILVIAIFLMFSIDRLDASRKSGQEILKNLTDESAVTILNDELRRINNVLINHESRISALEP